jgi:hypothetical protein
MNAATVIPAPGSHVQAVAPVWACSSCADGLEGACSPVTPQCRGAMSPSACFCIPADYLRCSDEDCANSSVNAPETEDVELPDDDC